MYPTVIRVRFGVRVKAWVRARVEVRIRAWVRVRARVEVRVRAWVRVGIGLGLELGLGLGLEGFRVRIWQTLMLRLPLMACSKSDDRQ